jgi:hypothetical protein
LQPPFAAFIKQCLASNYQHNLHFYFDVSHALNSVEFQEQKEFFLDTLYSTIMPNNQAQLHSYDNVSINDMSCELYDMSCLLWLTRNITQADNSPSLFQYIISYFCLKIFLGLFVVLALLVLKALTLLFLFLLHQKNGKFRHPNNMS